MCVATRPVFCHLMPGNEVLKVFPPWTRCWASLKVGGDEDGADGSFRPECARCVTDWIDSPAHWSVAELYHKDDRSNRTS